MAERGKEFSSYLALALSELAGSEEFLVLSPEESGRTLTLAVLAAYLHAQGLDLARLPRAEKRSIPDGLWLIEVDGERMALEGAKLADFIDDAIAQDSRQGEDGVTWTPSIVHDGERRLQLWTGSNGDWGYATENTQAAPPFDASTLTKVKAEAADVRGSAGRDGADGPGAPVYQVGRTAANKALVSGSGSGNLDVSVYTLSVGANPVLTTVLDEVSTAFPAGANAGQFVEIAADIPADGLLGVRVGDRYSALIPAAVLRGLTAAAAGDVPASDTGMSWGGSTDGSSGAVVVFASEAEMIAGLAADKAASALGVAERFAAFKGSAAGLTDADSDKWLPEGWLADLTEAQRETIQRLLDVLTIDGHWRTVGGERTWGNAPIGVPYDTTLDAQADSDDLRVRFVPGGPVPGGGSFVVPVATLRALPALPANPPSFLVSQRGWHSVQDPEGNAWGIALRGARLWVASDLDPAPRNLPYSVWLETRAGQLEDFAAADRADRVPPEKMAEGWVAFTAELRSKLAGIAARADVSVQSDLSVTDAADKAFVKGQTDLIGRVPRGVDVGALPTAQPFSTVELLVRESANRRDSVISFEAVAGQEYYGHGRGNLLAPMDASGAVETDTWTGEVYGLQWDSGDRNLFAWLKVGSVWDKILVNDHEHSMTELGQGSLPWDASAPPPRYRRVQVQVSAAEKAVIDDGLNAVRINFRDTDQADVRRQYLVGGPYQREAVVPDDKLDDADFFRLLATRFKFVDSAAARPDSHTHDDVTYFFYASAE